MGGYTWYKNSRLNRITAWHNTPTLDIPSEIIYIKDEETKEVCSLGCNPLPDDNNYNIIYGFGYAKYIHISNGIEQELITFVPREESVKVGLLKFKNTTPNKKKFSVYYYVKPVIGEDEIKSNQYIKLIYEEKNNIIFAKNMYEMELETPFVFVSSSEPIQEFTGNKKAFLGKGKLSMPDRNK
jgi:cyclic beta-1,2-glucan synthetase